MDFTEILNNFFGSDWMSSIMTILQSFVLVIVSFLSTKIKAKVNDVTTKYSDNLHKLLEKNNVTTDTLKNATAVLDKLNLETINAKQTIDVVIQVVGLLALDSKSIPANTKLTISKLLGSLEQNKDAVQNVEKVIEESKQIESIPVEQVEEIKHEVEVAAENSNQINQGIAEQTISVYNEIINE